MDHQTIEMFEQHLKANLEQLGTALQDESYRPQALRRKWIAKPEAGTPQGAVISPLLSNIYLDPWTTWWPRGGMRWCDMHDFVILCRSEAEAQRAWALVQQWTAAAGLTLHREKTRIVNATKHGGFDFLGYHFERGYRWPRRKSLKKLKDKIRVLTKRNNGQSLQVIISRVNPGF